MPVFCADSSPNFLHNKSTFNATTHIDFAKLSKHFDILQPMEYCSLVSTRLSLDAFVFKHNYLG